MVVKLFYDIYEIRVICMGIYPFQTFEASQTFVPCHPLGWQRWQKPIFLQPASIRHEHVHSKLPYERSYVRSRAFREFVSLDLLELVTV